MKRDKYQTPAGVLILIVAGGKLVYCNWETEDCNRKREKIEKIFDGKDNNDFSDAIDEKVLKETISQLEEYFDGKREVFQLPLNFKGTRFQQMVWEEMGKIAYGEKLTYKELANKIGRDKSARAVANACGNNPLAVIIPCHRVVASNGGTGGYTGGIDKKLWLLTHEIIFRG